MSLLQISHLQPLTMGQIIDRAIRLYRRNFLRFLGLAALVQIPATLLSLPLYFERLEGSPSQAEFLFIAIFLLLLVVSAIWSQIGAGALTQMVSDSYFGETPGIVAAVQKFGWAWLKLFGTLLLMGLSLIALLLFFIIPCIGQIAAIPGGGLLIYLALVITPLIVPVVVIERLSGRPAMRRAWEMARQRFWWMFGFFLLLSLFSFVVVQSPSYLLLFATSTVAAPLLTNEIQTLLQVVITALIGVLYLPVQVSCVLLVYFDLRVRQEGLDLALQAADGESVDPLRVLEQSPPVEGRLITGSEWGSFVGISLIGLALIGIFYLFMFLLILPTLNI